MAKAAFNEKKNLVGRLMCSLNITLIYGQSSPYMRCYTCGISVGECHCVCVCMLVLWG